MTDSMDLADIIFNFSYSAFALALSLFLLWLISLKIKDASIIDIFWGTGFVIVAIICFFQSEKTTPYIWLLASLPTIWGVRLSLYLGKRNLGHGEDYRYVAMRKRSRMKEMKWRIRSLFTIFFGQGILILIVSAPIWVGLAIGYGYYPETHPTLAYTERITNIGTLAILGTTVWLIGFLFEAIGDAQLARFKHKHAGYNGAYEDKPVLDTGLWKYTRHPNYFGNACMWWGIWMVACQAHYGVLGGWATVFSPLIMTYLLVRVSGKDLLERKLKSRTAYQNYMKRTPGFYPFSQNHKPKQTP